MRVLPGVAAAPGVALAPPQRLDPVRPGADGRQLTLDEASSEAAGQLGAIAARLADDGRAEEAAIFEAQALLAGDEELLGPARQRIDGGLPVDAAIEAAGSDAAALLEALDDETLAARGADVRDVAARVARAARGEASPRLERRVVVIADDLAPSVAAELDRSLLAGIALEAGSRTSHAAILARALGIPAVLGVAGLLDAAADAGELLVDGTDGTVTVEPDPDARERALASIAADRATADRNTALRHTPLATANGHRVTLAANLGDPGGALRAVEEGAEAVGLLRTEFMFLERASAPDEATQAAAYASVMRAFGARPVVVRLLDVGGDKPIPYLAQPAEANPFLGMRAIRLASRHPGVLATQLRAILRAAHAAGVREPRLMAPMVADLTDLRMVRGMLDEARVAVGTDLAPHLGIMVEVPSAVLLADQLAREAAFFSIGTNDLTQYLLAADRGNPALADRQDPMQPVVLRAVAHVVEAARDAGIHVAVCGEMAGDPVGAVALVGLGVDELSMEPAAFGSVKRAVGAVTLERAAELARTALTMDDASGVRDLFAGA